MSLDEARLIFLQLKGTAETNCTSVDEAMKSDSDDPIEKATKLATYLEVLKNVEKPLNTIHATVAKAVKLTPTEDWICYKVSKNIQTGLLIITYSLTSQTEEASSFLSEVTAEKLKVADYISSLNTEITALAGKIGILPKQKTPEKLKGFTKELRSVMNATIGDEEPSLPTTPEKLRPFTDEIRAATGQQKKWKPLKHNNEEDINNL